MADVTVKRLEEMDAIYGGSFVRARGSLGVTSFGMQVENLPPNHQDYPNHDHAGHPVDDRQEEVYIPLKGSAKLVVGDEEWQLEPGTMARVGATEMRKILPGAEGVQLLCLGGTPGQAFEVQAWSEPGGPVPEVPTD